MRFYLNIDLLKSRRIMWPNKSKVTQNSTYTQRTINFWHSAINKKKQKKSCLFLSKKIKFLVLLQFKYTKRNTLFEILCYVLLVYMEQYKYLPYWTVEKFSTDCLLHQLKFSDMQICRGFIYGHWLKRKTIKFNVMELKET